MLSTPDYFTELMAWGRANFINSDLIRSDSAFYQSSRLTALQQIDLGLLLQTLLKSDANRVHLRCDDWQQSDELFSTLLATLCFYKYDQNQAATPVAELYKTGTVLYHPTKEEARVVVCRHETGVKTRPIREGTVRVKREKHTQPKTFDPTFEQVAKYIPLANVAEHTYNRNALENLADYFELFNSTLHQHRALTQFPRRLLVVAPHATIQQLPTGSQFPIRYQFNRHYTVPVVYPLVEIVNRYNDAREVLRSDASLDEVVVLGDIGYREGLNDLLNDLGDGYVKRVIILGSQSIQPDYNFRCWPWSRAERTWLRTGRQARIERITLPADGLKRLRPLFVESASQLVAIGLSEAEANGAINRLVGQHLRDALVDSPALLTYQQSLLEEPDSVWRSWFMESDQLSSYPHFCQILMDGLRAVAKYIASNRTKLAKISELASRHQLENKLGCRTWIVARSKQAEALNLHFTDNKTIRAISYRELKTLLNKPAEGLAEQFIFPALHLNYQPGGNLLRDYSLYRRATERGPGYVLAYEGLEDGLANLCEWLYQRDEHRCLIHPDRQHWVNFSCASTLPSPLAQTSVNGILEPLPATAADTIGELLDELELLGDNNAEKPTRTAEILLKLNESFTNYFGVWKDIRKSRRKDRVCSEDTPDEEESAPVISITPTPAQAGSRIQISFSNRRDYEYKASALLALSVNRTIRAIRADSVRKNNQIVHFAIDFDGCREALLTIPEAKVALNEVKWASKAWRDWLRDSIQRLATSKTIHWEAACRTQYQRLCEQVKQQDPADSFVSQSRFEFWLTESDPYLFPRKISHLEAVLSTCLKLVAPTSLAAKQAEQRRIMTARDQSASFREVVTRLNHELTVYLIEKKKGAMLAHLSEQHLAALLRTQTLLTVTYTCQL